MRLNQRIIITGGSGFIGSFLVQRLVKKGLSNVIVLDKHPELLNGAYHVVCDVFKEIKILRDILQEGDIVVHLACTTIPGTSEIEVVKDAGENIAGTLTFLNVCRDKKVGKIIFPSSGGAIYGNQGKETYAETDRTNPVSSYGVIKLAIEKYLGVYEHLYGLKNTILRIGNPYGRKKFVNSKLGAVDVFLRRAIEKEKIVVWGDGKNVRDYIHIDDVIDFILLAIVNDSVSGIYNVGTGHGTSLSGVIEIVSKLLQTEIQTEYKESRSVDVEHNVLDIEKAKKIGWKAKYTLIQGLERLHNTITASEASGVS